MCVCVLFWSMILVPSEFCRAAFPLAANRLSSPMWDGDPTWILVVVFCFVVFFPSSSSYFSLTCSRIDMNFPSELGNKSRKIKSKKYPTKKKKSPTVRSLDRRLSLLSNLALSCFPVVLFFRLLLLLLLLCVVTCCLSDWHGREYLRAETREIHYSRPQIHLTPATILSTLSPIFVLSLFLQP